MTTRKRLWRKNLQIVAPVGVLDPLLRVEGSKFLR